ncbi:hypothetical protein ACLMJK_002825 [Lecanora helva]
MAQVWNIWKVGYKPFQDVGSDTFVLATPAGNLLWTCDPKVVSELERQHPSSQLAVDLLKFFEVYGPTVGSVEGEEWRKHRKIITSGLNSATNIVVWKNTILQTSSLINHWLGLGGKIPVMKHWTSRLALHVISDVFFRRQLSWRDSSNDSEPPPPGHQMSFEKALFTVLARLGTLYVTPRALLGKIPLKNIREAHIAFIEWTQYMEELRAETIERLDEISKIKHPSILESIVLAGTPDQSETGYSPLPTESILGNIFFTLLSGHETTGNTMAFALNILAVYPEYQENIQRELDQLLSQRPWQEWTLEQEYQSLQQGWLNAVLKEAMRLYGVVQYVPRNIVAPIDVVDSKGISHNIPEKTLCLMNFSAAFQNPTTWDRRAVPEHRRTSLHDSPALDFDPTRWLDKKEGTARSQQRENSIAPAFFPFGQGPHSCPGRAFAHVEMVAVLATILKDYCLELVIDEQTKQNHCDDEQAARDETRDRAFRNLVDDIETNISVQLLKDLPIKLVKRDSHT